MTLDRRCDLQVRRLRLRLQVAGSRTAGLRLGLGWRLAQDDYGYCYYYGYTTRSTLDEDWVEWGENTQE
jgi:hypothetical protein